MIRRTALQWAALGFVAWSGVTKAQSSSWELACRDNELEDARECLLASGEISIFGLRTRFGAGIWLISIDRELRSGSQMVLRVDANPPVALPAEPATSDESLDVIRQMAGGTRLQARYLDAQDGAFHEIEIDLTGFREQVIDMQERLQAYAS